VTARQALLARRADCAVAFYDPLTTVAGWATYVEAVNETTLAVQRPCLKVQQHSPRPQIATFVGELEASGDLRG